MILVPQPPLHLLLTASWTLTTPQSGGSEQWQPIGTIFGTSIAFSTQLAGSDATTTIAIVVYPPLALGPLPPPLMTTLDCPCLAAVCRQQLCLHLRPPLPCIFFPQSVLFSARQHQKQRRYLQATYVDQALSLVPILECAASAHCHGDQATMNAINQLATS
jgi:hypothetical protein